MALYLYTTVAAYLSTTIEKLHSDERGQDTLEWTMITGLMAVAILGMLGLMTGALTSFAGGVKNCVDFDSATACVAGL